MRILMVHNDYGRYSGEEAVVDQFVADGRAGGYEMEVLRCTSKFARDSFWGQIRGFFSGIYSRSGVRMMRRAIRSFRPDVVHIHNLYPFISPAALFECKRADIPVIMTVHNYRLICPTGLFLRNGKPCEECLIKGNENGCIRYNCEGNRFRSLGYALRNRVARKRGSYLKNVDYYCCLTQFQKEKLAAAGFPEDRIFVFPNYMNMASRSVEAGLEGKNFVGYVGRLSEEKGFDLLVEVARRHPEIQFRFAGVKRENETIVQLPNVEYCGQLGKEALTKFYEDARFVVIPSRCYEGFPLVIPEAYSKGVPCVVPNHGPFPELIHNGNKYCGRTFVPSDVDDLEKQVISLWNAESELIEYSHNAVDAYNKLYTKKVLNQRWHKFLHQVALHEKISV